MDYTKVISTQTTILYELNDYTKDFVDNIKCMQIHDNKETLTIIQEYENNDNNGYYIENVIESKNDGIITMSFDKNVLVSVEISKGTKQNWFYDENKGLYYFEQYIPVLSHLQTKYYHYNRYVNHHNINSNEDFIRIDLINDGNSVKIRLYTENPIITDTLMVEHFRISIFNIKYFNPEKE